ncbi:MAG: DUF2933 domain-containing protein [Pseudomonadota bacterium]
MAEDSLARSLFGIAVTLLIIDHRAHALGMLPYLVLLACLLMHSFMHDGHDHYCHEHGKTILDSAA